MTTQIVFKVDAGIKAKAMKRAHREGIPFASVLKMATKAFAEGHFSVGIIDEVMENRLAILERESKRIDTGKGKRFASMNAFRAHVRAL
jgi:hypothetical protein